MSDKTKHNAELAAMVRAAAGYAGPEPLPRCACGKTWLETSLWALPAGPDGRSRFCCAACAPDEARGAMGRRWA